MNDAVSKLLYIGLYFINRGPLFFDRISEKESLKIIKFLFSKYHKISKLKLLRFNPNLEIIRKPLPSDDPMQRQPIIKLAKDKLRWEPKISLEEGLEQTIKWFKETI